MAMATMSEARTANAMAYGMMAAEPGIDVLCLGEMGIANTTTAATSNSQPTSVRVTASA